MIKPASPACNRPAPVFVSYHCNDLTEYTNFFISLPKKSTKLGNNMTRPPINDHTIPLRRFTPEAQKLKALKTLKKGLMKLLFPAPKEVEP